MTKQWWKHKRLPMIAVSVADRDRYNGPGERVLLRVNRYRTFQQPVDLSLVTEHFDEWTESEYNARLMQFPDRHSSGTWEVDIVTGVERQVFLT